MIEPTKSEQRTDAKPVRLLGAVRSAAAVGAASLSLAFFSGDRPTQDLPPSEGGYVLNSGTATVHNLGSYAWEVDPDLVREIARRSAACHTAETDQPFVEACVRAQVFLELFQGRTDFQLFFRPALRGAAIQALAQTSEQAARYCNRTTLRGAPPDSDMVSMPLYFLTAANQINNLKESDLALRWAEIADQSAIALDDAPTNNLERLSKEVRGNLDWLLEYLAAPDSAGSATS